MTGHHRSPSGNDRPLDGNSGPVDPPALVVFDFDGTLAEQRGSWGLCYRAFGTEDAGERRTEAYRDGEISFEQWCEGNVRDWRERGVTRENIRRIADAIKLTTGAEDVLESLADEGIPFGVLSSGIADLMARIDRFDPQFVLSNEIIYDESVPVGVTATVGPNDKGTALRTVCDRLEIDPLDVTYVGDSHSDVEAFEVAGTSVLFDPDARIEDEAYELVDHVERDRDLRRILPVVPGTRVNGSDG